MTVQSGLAICCAVVCLNLLACGGSGDPVAHPPPPGDGGGGNTGRDGGGGSLAVAGQVLDNTGQPVAARTVLVGTQSTTTDASGHFSFSGVSTPYDLTLVATSPDKTAVVYQGLTRADPKVLDLTTQGTFQHTAHLQGTLFGANPFDGTIVAVVWASPEAVAGVYVDAFPYDLGIAWSGASSITGTLHALQWTIDESGLPTAYQGIGVKNFVSLDAGTTVTTGDMNLEIPATQTVTTTLSPPTGYTLVDRRADVMFPDGAFFTVASNQASATGFSVLVPTGSDIRISALAENPSGSAQIIGSLAGVAPGTSNATLTLPTPALPTLPANGATGVGTTTNFSWSALAGGVHFVFFTGANSTSPTFAIITAGTSTQLPDLTSQGLALPPAELYQWAVIGLSPLASVDAVAGTGTIALTGTTTFESIADSTFTTR
jgi:hypothetical protein